MKGCIDYSACRLQQTVLRKHLFKNQVYNLYVLDDVLILSLEVLAQKPKYVLPLSCKNLISWKFTSENKQKALTSFGFSYKGKIKYFEGVTPQMQKLKETLANLVVFSDVADFYNPLQLIGRGGSSKVAKLSIIFQKVYLVQERETKLQYASKCIEKSYLMEDGCFEQLYQEIDCMLRVQHPNIIKLYEIFEGEKTFYMILEELKGQSLSEVLHTQRKLGYMDFNTIRIILKQILLAVQVIHSKGMMHRDLKPDNIMFKTKGNINSLKIVDFGLAQLEQTEPYKFPKCGTPGYVAPEVANLKDLTRTYGQICDIFSIGSIFYKLITLNDLFPGVDFEEQYRMNRKCQINLQILTLFKTPSSATDLIGKMLDLNPNVRITATAALNHKFFSEDFDKAIQKPNDVKAKFQNQKKSEVESTQPLWKTHDLPSTGQNQIQSNKKQIDLNDDFSIEEDPVQIIQVPVMKNLKFKLGSFMMKEDLRKPQEKPVNPKQKGFKKFQSSDFDQNQLNSPVQNSNQIPSFIEHAQKLQDGSLNGLLNLKYTADNMIIEEDESKQ